MAVDAPTSCGTATCPICKRSDAAILITQTAVVAGKRFTFSSCSWCWVQYEREIAEREQERAA